MAIRSCRVWSWPESDSLGDSPGGADAGVAFFAGRFVAVVLRGFMGSSSMGDKRKPGGRCDGYERERREQHVGHGCTMRVDMVVSCRFMKICNAKNLSGGAPLEMGWSLCAMGKVSQENVAKESRRRGMQIRGFCKRCHSLDRPMAVRKRAAGGRLAKTPRRSAELDSRIVSGAPA